MKKRSEKIIVILQGLILLTAVLLCLWSRGQRMQSETLLQEAGVEAGAVREGTSVNIDANSGQKGVFLKTQKLSLRKGTYLVILEYAGDRPGNRLSAYSSSLGSLEMHAPSVELDTHKNRVIQQLELERAADDVVIECYFNGEGALGLMSLSIYETGAGYKKNLFYAVLLCALLFLGECFYCTDDRKRKTMLALAGIFAASCYPLYTDYLMAGHDLPFHLLRIEGIKEGLLNGSFPVKIHPFWAKDYGYAVGVFYGDAFLYFPATLRILGFSVQSAYKYYVAAVNLGTVLIAYFAFRKMFRSQPVGILGAAAYSLSLYRLANLYTRASVGEYTAMMFFPLVLCGFYLIFCKREEPKWWKAPTMVAVGLTGVIQSHVLSCLMLAFLIVLTCLVLIRRVLQWRVLRELLLGVGMTILLNAGFLVPFLDMYREDIMIRSAEWKGSTIGNLQANGLFPLQILGLFQRATGSAWATSDGVSAEPAFSVGILLCMGLALGGYLILCRGRQCREDKNGKPFYICGALGALTLYMSTCYFPWNAIADSGELLKKLVYNIEFPWRMLAPACVLLTFVLCFSVQKFCQCYDRRRAEGIIMCMLVLAVVNCGWFLYDFTYSSVPYRVYFEQELDSMTMYSYDYLPAGTDPELIRENQIITNGATLEYCEKQGTKMLCRAAAEQEDGSIDFPLNFYKYYEARDLDHNEKLRVTAGYNNQVRVILPQNYEGAFQVSFREPIFWRISEILSIMTFVVLAGGLLFEAVAAKRQGQEP